MVSFSLREMPGKREKKQKQNKGTPDFRSFPPSAHPTDAPGLTLGSLGWIGKGAGRSFLPKGREIQFQFLHDVCFFFGRVVPPPSSVNQIRDRSRLFHPFVVTS